MATIKKRINISVSRDVEKILERLAKRDQMPQATKAEHLIAVALELEEDEMLNAVSSRRDQKRTTFISHSSAWR